MIDCGCCPCSSSSHVIDCFIPSRVAIHRIELLHVKYAVETYGCLVYSFGTLFVSGQDFVLPESRCPTPDVQNSFMMSFFDSSPPPISQISLLSPSPHQNYDLTRCSKTTSLQSKIFGVSFSILTTNTL